MATVVHLHVDMGAIVTLGHPLSERGEPGPGAGHQQLWPPWKMDVNVSNSLKSELSNFLGGRLWRGPEFSSPEDERVCPRVPREVRHFTLA